MSGSQDGSPRKMAKLELQNYTAKLWASIVPDAALLVVGEEAAAQCLVKIQKVCMSSGNSSTLGILLHALFSGS